MCVSCFDLCVDTSGIPLKLSARESLRAHPGISRRRRRFGASCTTDVSQSVHALEFPSNPARLRRLLEEVVVGGVGDQGLMADVRRRGATLIGGSSPVRVETLN